MLIEEITYYSDSSYYFEKIKHLEWPVFLDSCYQKDRPQSKYARFDIVAANPFIKITHEVTDGYIIALQELAEKKIPVIIRRPLPNGGSEYWPLKELEIIG